MESFSNVLIKSLCSLPLQLDFNFLMLAGAWTPLWRKEVSTAWVVSETSVAFHLPCLNFFLACALYP